MASVPKDLTDDAAANESARPQAPRDVVDYELLFDCVHCGLCLEACPTYVVTRAEMDSPRGRIYLMKALAEGRLELDADAVRHLDLCLGCRGCETACPSGVRYGRLIERARGYVERNWRRSLSERIRNRLIAAVFPHPGRLRAMLAPVSFAERIGLRSALQRLSPRALRDWLELLPQLNRNDEQPSAEPPTTPGGDASSVIVHPGCVAQVLTPSANLNSELALARAGYRIVRATETTCCGALDLHNGDIELARKSARANIIALKASSAEKIVSAASGCSAVVAGYGELLKDDPEFAAAARDISGRVADLSSLLLACGNPLRAPFKATVTYHDACHLVHGMGVREAPRQLLRSIPGVRLIELAESDLCCGSAGSYNLTERATARELARRKADNVIATGADYLVLSNPGCEFQIAAELKRRGSPIRVIHLADFLAMALAASPVSPT